MTHTHVTLLATGDLIIDEPDPASYFELARPVLRAADVVVGHVEVPFRHQTCASPAGEHLPRPPYRTAAGQRSVIGEDLWVEFAA